MSENFDKQEPTVAVRLASRCRTLASAAEKCADIHEPGSGSSGREGAACFVDDWLEDGEEEALLHQALDALDHEDKCEEENEELRTGHSCTCKRIAMIAIGIARAKGSAAACTTTGMTGTTTDDRLSGESSLAMLKDGGLQSDGESQPCEKCRARAKRRTEAVQSSSTLEHFEELISKKSGVPGISWKKMKTGTCDDEGHMTPLKWLKGRCLWVSDLTSQAWCEMKLVYDCTFMMFEGPVEILETPAMKVGSEMHLKRELEVHTIKKIAVSTREDKWAIKCLNILSAIGQLLEGGRRGGAYKRVVVREMPIFGWPFQGGAFLIGVIDEVRQNSKDQLELVEFKTRSKTRTVPHKAQRKTHKLQVMVYKQLFDEAVCGLLKKETILETMGLDPDATLNDEVTAHALKKGLELAKFGDYLDIMLDRFQFLSKIENLFVEYSSQEDEEPFAVDEYAFDPVWLKDRLDYYNAFWDGRREVEGVDVEEVWKCNFCSYVEECNWRKKMHEKCLSQKTACKVKIGLTE